MTRQLELEREVAQERKDQAATNAINYGLAGAVQAIGGELLGFSAKMQPEDVLLTLRAEFDGGRMIAFAGGYDLPSALIKAVNEVRANRVKWREDEYSK